MKELLPLHQTQVHAAVRLGILKSENVDRAIDAFQKAEAGRYSDLAEVLPEIQEGITQSDLDAIRSEAKKQSPGSAGRSEGARSSSSPTHSAAPGRAATKPSMPILLGVGALCLALGVGMTLLFGKREPSPSGNLSPGAEEVEKENPRRGGGLQGPPRDLGGGESPGTKPGPIEPDRAPPESTASNPPVAPEGANPAKASDPDLPKPPEAAQEDAIALRNWLLGLSEPDLRQLVGTDEMHGYFARVMVGLAFQYAGGEGAQASNEFLGLINEKIAGLGLEPAQPPAELEGMEIPRPEDVPMPPDEDGGRR